ncbi:hypothetical protein RTP6_000997 [Batrachochytrium dendrobatidis]
MMTADNSARTDAVDLPAQPAQPAQPTQQTPSKPEKTVDPTPLEPTTYTSIEDQAEEDEILRELEEEDDDDMAAIFRERRMNELRAEAHRLRQMGQARHGHYETIRTEKDILHITTTAERCVVHFSHKDFRRCQLMDQHMQELAKKHFKTRFIKIDVADAPFLVDKLKIQILPCIMAFIDGVTVDKLLGFEGVSEKDDFPTSMLEKRLTEGSKVIVLDEINKAGANSRRTILGFANTKSRNDSDSEDDE